MGNGVGVDGVPSIQGVAPGSTMAFYPFGGVGDTEVCGTFGGIAEALAIDQAVADGADVINLSFGLGATPEPIDSYTGTPLYHSIVAAQQAGVVVVTSTVNEGGSELGFPANVNGVVAVEALTSLGAVSQPQIVSPGLGIVAPGALLPDLEESPEDVWPVSGPWGSGTSLASPIVSSAIALSMSAWPEATPNQVLQALAHTASPLDGSAAGAGTRSPEWGFGALDLPALIATDPTQFPDENPFLRPDGMPAPEDVAVAATPDPTPATDEATDEPTTVEPEPATPDVQSTSADADEQGEEDDGGSALPFIIGGAALVVVLAVAGVALARRRSAL